MAGSGGVSRRALFGAGLGRLLDERLARAEPAPAARAAEPAAAPSPPSPLGWGEGDADGLGSRLGDVHAAILAEAGVGPGSRVLDVAAGDGALALRAAQAGAAVTAVEADPERVARGTARAGAAGLEVAWRCASPDSLPEEDVDAVVSAFGATYAPPDAAAAALVRAVRPGGAIVLTAWTGLMAELLRLARTPDGPRPEAWGRYETAYRHFFDFPGLDVRETGLTWTFADAAEAVAVLAAPAAPQLADRVAAALPGLVERYALPGATDDERLRVSASYALVTARRP